MINDIINAGELNKLIILKKRTRVRNSFGEEISTYIAFATVWAKIEQTSSSTENTEMRQGKKERTRKTLSFMIRYISDLTTDMIIEYANKQYDILNINNVNMTNKKLIIKAEFFK